MQKSKFKIAAIIALSISSSKISWTQHTAKMNKDTSFFIDLLNENVAYLTIAALTMLTAGAILYIKGFVQGLSPSYTDIPILQSNKQLTIGKILSIFGIILLLICSMVFFIQEFQK